MSDILEFTCWNGEVVRIAFALDCHDREVISWIATTAGISGETIRDLMVECVERRFSGVRAPHPIQWLADNGSVYAAAKRSTSRSRSISSPALPRSKARKATVSPRHS